MVGAVNQDGLEVDHRETSQRAVFLGLQALLDAGNVFLRNRATNDRVLEDESLRTGFGAARTAS